MGWGADSDGLGSCGENRCGENRCGHNIMGVDSRRAGAPGGILGVIQR